MSPKKGFGRRFGDIVLGRGWLRSRPVTSDEPLEPTYVASTLRVAPS